MFENSKFWMHQQCILFKSAWKIAWELGFVNGKQRFMSLAYIIRTTWGTSFMKIPRRRGPRWLSCGTPEVTWTRLEIELLKVQFDKFVEIHSVNVIVNPKSIIFFSIIADGLRNRNSVWKLYLKALLMTEVNSRRFVDVDLRFVKPCRIGDMAELHWCCSWAVISWSIHLLIALCFAIPR